MNYKVKICETIIQRLTYVNKPCTGSIYGIYEGHNVIIIELQRNLANDGISDISNIFPTPIQNCGTFTVDDNDASCHTELDKFHVFCNQNTKEVVVKTFHENSTIEALYEIVNNNDILTKYWMLQVKGGLPFRCEASKTSIQESFMILQSQISSENLAFRIKELNTYVLNSNVICGMHQDNITLKQLFESFYELQAEPDRKKKAKAISPTIFVAEFLQKISVGEVEVSLNHAPLCILDKSTKKIVDTFCKIDTLVMISVDSELLNIYSILQQALLKYLLQYESKFWPCFKENTSLELDAYHFYPSECGHFLTLLYPASKSDKDLATERLKLHQQLMLNENVPIFRRASKFINNKNKVNGPLINPHIGVRTIDNGGNTYLVRGNYEYYHYCQNGMDDSGWGCAYRSLQTLASWLKLQGYVHREVPTFPEIQKCLVDIKDKPSSFLGSKQWIGSTEVNFVLDSLLGITCKILYVSSGEEMSQKGPELVDHFNNQGSPIMIGGGVLAHTILGVDYNPQTGNIYFLILDPHYTGAEDLHTIQSKGWCGWKPVSFWQKGSYYNLCLPQVPRGV